MKSQLERDAESRDRALAAIRLADDEFVSAWFAAERTEAIETMISAGVTEDDRRRSAAMQIKALDGLKSHIEATAATGRKALEKQDKRDKINGR